MTTTEKTTTADNALAADAVRFIVARLPEFARFGRAARILAAASEAAKLLTRDPEAAAEFTAEEPTRLIAAAPDLLAACRAVAKCWESGDLAASARACARAVALATGTK